MGPNEFWCRPSRRDGRPLSHGEKPEVLLGRLRLKEQFDPWLLRSISVAMLEPEEPVDVTPALLDIQLLRLDRRRIVLTGFQRDPLLVRDVGQTWVLYGHSNEFWVLPVRRGGAPIPRWQQSQGTWLRGFVDVAESFDENLRRTVVLARLRSGEGASEDLLPPLVDVRLARCDHAQIILAGHEIAHPSQQDLAQAWLLLRSDAAPSGAGLRFPDP